MHALFGTHKEAALPFFEQLLPDFHSLILVSEMLYLIILYVLTLLLRT